MNPAVAIAALNGALSLSNTLIPLVAQYRKEGLITEAEQAEVLARYNSLKAATEGQFAGPAWQQSGLKSEQ